MQYVSQSKQRQGRREEQHRHRKEIVAEDLAVKFLPVFIREVGEVLLWWRGWRRQHEFDRRRDEFLKRGKRNLIEGQMPPGTVPIQDRRGDLVGHPREKRRTIRHLNALEQAKANPTGAAEVVATAT
ncbi:MAG: hypothetical protein B7Z55_14060, partial [Planctomycetales bacterium 12-60-4]